MISKWFSPAELACKCGQCAPGIVGEFVVWLDSLRAAVARPLTLTSAYRCPDHDRKVGGKGPHTTGRAADVRAITSAEKHELVGAALALGAKGVGVGATFIHVDLIVPGGKYPRPAIWSYPVRG